MTMGKKNQKKTYRAPKCSLVHMGETSPLMVTSMRGQHNPAEDGGTIILTDPEFHSQHSSAEDGGTITAAKRMQLWQMEDEEDD